MIYTEDPRQRDVHTSVDEVSARSQTRADDRRRRLTTEQPTRVRYTGSPLFASSLGGTLEALGVHVRFDDVEPCGSEDGTPTVTVHYMCSASRAAIRAAVQYFLDGCERGITVEVLDTA